MTRWTYGSPNITAAVKVEGAPEGVVDTLVLARRKHPGGHNTLDDLCSRYGVNSLRNKHGAMATPSYWPRSTSK